MDIEKLPESIQFYLKNILMVLNPTVPVDILILQLEAKIAHFLCSERFYLQANATQPIPPNFYGFIFYKSGGGKNRPLSHIDDLIFDQWYETLNHEWKTWRDFQVVELQKTAEATYVNLKTKQAEFIDQHRPRLLQKKMGDATSEGLISDRGMLSQWGKGSTFLYISEFSDYILSRNSTRNQLISLIKEIYDIGDSEVKIIKGEKESKEIRGVPLNALFTASPRELLREPGKELFLKWLTGGLARRCFVVFPKPVIKKIKRDTFKNELERYNEIAEAKSTFFEAVENLKQHDRKITFSPKAWNFFSEWRAETYNQAQETNREEIEMIDLENIYWKTEKLAALFTAWSGQNMITLGFLESAIYQATYCNQELGNFIKEHNQEFEKLYELLKRGWITTMELRKANLVPWHNFINWLKDNLILIEEKAFSEDMVLNIESVGKTGKKYKLSKFKQ